MKATFETLDGGRFVKDCPDVENDAVTIMAPLWRGYPTIAGSPPQYMEWRKYERTGERDNCLPVFREVSEAGKHPDTERLEWLAAQATAPDWLRDWPMMWRLKVYLNVSNHEDKQPSFIEAIDAARQKGSA